eukprot:augustus_masked-scaffold_23-processed-gene-2.59-mRNA-1 protein AED:0.37 eAED:0.37 QI:0/0/0/0.5/1/1/2/0/1380
MQPHRVQRDPNSSTMEFEEMLFKRAENTKTRLSRRSRASSMGNLSVKSNDTEALWDDKVSYAGSEPSIDDDLETEGKQSHHNNDLQESVAKKFNLNFTRPGLGKKNLFKPTPKEFLKRAVSKLGAARRRKQSNKNLESMESAARSEVSETRTVEDNESEIDEMLEESSPRQHMFEFQRRSTKLRQSQRFKSSPLDITPKKRFEQNMKNLDRLKNQKLKLRSQVQGIAAKLSSEKIMQVKLLGKKSYFSMDQLLTHFFHDKVLKPEQQKSYLRDPISTLYFRLYVCKEVCKCLSLQHLKQPPQPHGAISAESVLLDRNLKVEMQKAKVIKIANEEKTILRMQGDILFLGVVLLEIMVLKRVGHKFCNLVLTAQENEVLLGKEWNQRNPSYQSFRAFRPKNRNNVQRQIPDWSNGLNKQVGDALTHAFEQLAGAEGIEDFLLSDFQTDLRRIILRCLSVVPGERPVATEIENVFEYAICSLFPSIDHERELIDILGVILNNRAITGRMKRSPPIMDRTLNRSTKNLGELRRKPKTSPNKSAPGMTRSNFGEVSIEEECLNPNDDESYLSSAAEREVKKEEEIKKKKPKPKKATRNGLMAFLSRNGAVDEDLEEQSTQSQKPRSKPMSLADYSTIGDNEDYQADSFSPVRARSESDDGVKRKKIQANVRASTAIRTEDLRNFQANLKAFSKSIAKEQKQKFSPNIVATLFDTQQLLNIELAKGMLKKAGSIFNTEPNVLSIEPNLTIVGDIHGQYFDLRNIIETLGRPGKKNNEQKYLFLGDYVDRGDFSCEVFFYLLALKIRYPAHVFLLRGNHESRVTSRSFGFKEECESKYGTNIFSKACAVFDTMPIAAIVNTSKGKFFCLHGGISPNVTTIDQFKEFDRFQEPSLQGGFLCDVLWADPVLDEDAEQDALEFLQDEYDLDEETEEFKEEIEKKRKEFMDSQLKGEYFTNSLRRCSYRFGMAALTRFLQENELKGIIRAHQVQMEGFTYHFQDLAFENPDLRGSAKTPEEVCPPIITVFSAADYCGKYGNKGAYLNIYNAPPEYADTFEAHHNSAFSALDLLEPVQYEAVDAPPPVQFANVKEKKQFDLEKYCPYMPQDLESLIERALTLGKTNSIKEVQNERKTSSVAKMSKGFLTALGRKKSKVQNPSKQKKDEMHRTLAKTKRRLPRRNTLKKFNSLKKETEFVQPDNWKKFEDRMKDYKQSALGKYALAKKNDRMMEASPMFITDKVSKAKTKFGPGLGNISSKNLDINITSVSDLKQSILDPRNEQEENKLLEEKRVQWQEMLASKTVKFEESELLALQTYFLIIDIQDSGKIGVDDLVRWTKDEGGFVVEDHAQMALDIIDFDKDGYIGFEDFLVFSAAAKRIWMAEQLDLFKE